MTTASPQDRIEGYARGLLEIARAEGDAEAIADQVFQVAAAFMTSEPLRTALTDRRIPVDRKRAIVEELIGDRAARVALAMVDFVITAGYARDLEAIAERMVALAAAQEEAEVAYVRSAVELDQEAIRKLEQKLSELTGKRITAKVVVDPSVVGGVVARIGDLVIDGSVRRRLEELREALV